MQSIISIPIKKRTETVQRDGINYHYATFGSEIHGKRSFILWISDKLINKEDNSIYYPLSANLIKGEKNLILKPGDNFVFEIITYCGFRGRSSLEITSPLEATALKYYIYHSPRGNLGISEGALIITPEMPVTIKIKRTGRLYGEPEVAHILIRDDLKFTIISTEGLDELDQLLKE